MVTMITKMQPDDWPTFAMYTNVELIRFNMKLGFPKIESHEIGTVLNN